MRVFWILMGLLVVVAAGVVFAKRGGDEAPVREVAARAPESVPGPSTPRSYEEGVDEVVRSLSAQREAQPEVVIEDRGPEPFAREEASPDLDELLGTQDEEAPVADAQGAPIAETEVPDPTDAEPGAQESELEIAAIDEPEVSELQDSDVVIGSPDDEGETVELAGATNDDAPMPEVELSEAVGVPVAVQEQEDGSLLINGAYVVRGEGTTEKPYELGLDLLVSVQDEYNPRKGKSELPAWLDRFQGKQVRVVGNLLFPLWADETDEVLLMKNQWDGCCVGVPPTPYDAIEVKLAQAVDLSRVAADYGTIEGRFEIEPYIRSNWLLGLYVIDGAKLAR